MASEQEDQPVFYDALIHQRRRHGHYRTIDGPLPPLEHPLADSHCHLASLSQRDLSLARAALWKVDFICDITDPIEDAGRTYTQLPAWELSARSWMSVIAPETEASLPRIRLACGCHPHNAKDFTEFVEARLITHLKDERTCCMGEVGLDYHYDLSPRDLQQQVFRRQIQLAHESGLPIALHVREAHEEALAILDDEGFPAAGTILHCCSLSPHDLEPWLDHGCYIAYGGALTFKKLDEAREGMKLVPIDRLLLETDCPYMTPEPLRGTENSPEFIVFTAERLAAERGISAGNDRRDFLATLHANTLSLLDRPATSWQTHTS